jgi:hypothetical protein
MTQPAPALAAPTKAPQDDGPLIGRAWVTGLVLILAWVGMAWVEPVRQRPIAMLSGYSVACAAWALACWGVLGRRRPPRMLWIVVVAVACRLAALPGEPSDDMARYRWEGLVQLEGLNPYRLAPDDPALAGLADRFDDHATINHPAWPAIYPPGMQLWHRAVAAVSPTALAFKLSFLAAEALLALALVSWLRRRGLPAARVLVFLWCPLSVFATALEGHNDVVAAAALVTALLALEYRRPTTAALFACAAVLTKGFAIAALPALAIAGRRTAAAAHVSDAAREQRGAIIPPRCWWAGFALVAVVSTPFLGQGGPWTTLLRFGGELHYNDSLHAMFAQLVGQRASGPLAILAWLIGAGIVVTRSAPDPARRVALLLAGLLLVLPSLHPWYPMTLLPLLCVFPWWGWMAFSCTVCLTWLPHLEIAATGRWVEWHELKLPEYAPLFAWLAWRLFITLRPAPPLDESSAPTS